MRAALVAWTLFAAAKACVQAHNHGTYCDNEEVNPPDRLSYRQTPSSEPFKAMIVGDSISHGMEGDFTWRWRLYSWRKRPRPLGSGLARSRDYFARRDLHTFPLTQECLQFYSP